LKESGEVGPLGGYKWVIETQFLIAIVGVQNSLSNLLGPSINIGLCVLD
jgi:hypothetical protein